MLIACKIKYEVAQITRHLQEKFKMKDLESA